MAIIHQLIGVTLELTKEILGRINTGAGIGNGKVRTKKEMQSDE